jgi:hypothetical protein
MDLILTTKSQQNPGPDISINCPLCDATEAPAESFEQVDELGLFWLIPHDLVRRRPGDEGCIGTPTLGLFLSVPAAGRRPLEFRL